ncbi:MAG: class I SAM-dependent methyltransferase [Bacilli bacterium]|jgi:glycine/sarcosine N-methyltransferase|nr:class I SAM-dependent methyltransferase [Bacilli bacterium]HHV04777.1 class I SAM-dependent methyltransferase [Bacteroidales bacterium]
MIDLYERFAFDYDEFGPIEEYLGDEKTFLNKIFAEHGVRNVLDCACGTGQHLLMMAQSGYNVWGSDYSKSMLEVAHRNLQKRGYNIPLCQCDFRYLEQAFNMDFDAIVCLTNSLPHLQTDEDLLTALRSMKNRLNKNGVLVLTQGTTHFTLTLPSIEVVVNRSDFSRIFVKEQDGRFQTIHVLDLYHSAERLESNQYDIVYRILLDEDYKKLLSQAGFTNIQIYGDYKMNAYDEKSWRLIVVAEALPN